MTWVTHLFFQDKSADEDSESLSREELGRLVASRWTGEKSDHKDEVDASPNKDHQDLDETQSEINDEEDNGYVSEDDEHKYDHDDDDDGNSDESYDHTDDLGREDLYDPSSSPNLESDDELDLTGTSVPC